MRKLNPKHVDAIITLINRSPYFELLSMVILDMGIGYSLVEVDLENKHLNPFGGIHGGVYASIIDTAAYWAIYCELDENVGLVSLDLKVNNLAPIKSGKLIINGRRIKFGRIISLAEAVVTSEEGKILAQGTSTLMQTSGLQTIKEAISLTGEKPPPSKFIEEECNFSL
ncbi:PaaI family thioesterase [Desulfoscipio gibsoniae]|uniref:Thioesterase domain-containing protein n=1 Tax=Desulfoscipio gibsoniae DSM 7213 TaxID=767817 RepID=R4KHA6_9FIRM|nr:PaaI family thioesterase [Desulfoscipio gibsoniae]AGL02583.1 hypothetical protein Desgi_3232 [Desulfoscipio gibsoniae DSM 7213]